MIRRSGESFDHTGTSCLPRGGNMPQSEWVAFFVDEEKVYKILKSLTFNVVVSSLLYILTKVVLD